ncbi:MAG: glycosyltransferase family 2 protein [Cyanobacteriota bacterium]|nr:glycosyltransferase family 2 protein [Cyanobacteriota bacterium]
MILVLAALTLIAIAIYRQKLRHSLAEAPQLHPTQENISHLEVGFPTISVIIPAYNEAENIQDCVTAVLNSTQLPDTRLDVWVVDDQSTDDTLLLVQSLQQLLDDPRLKVLPGQPRPTDEIWVGKNWACTQGVEQAKGEFLLFIDADVRLKPDAIETAVQKAQLEQSELLSLAPGIICGCFSEWLVQPLMVNNLAVGQDFGAVNDPKSEVAFAAGPFMLFRRSAYEQLGGHRAVADRVVEDVELARRTKAAGLKLSYLLGGQFVSVQMYRSWQALWEGWTKNLYLGAQRDAGSMLYLAFAMLVIYPLPWLCLAAVGYKSFTGIVNPWDLLAASLAASAIFFHYDLRRVSGGVSQIPTKYWWLGGIGGTIVAALALASVIKTETGWGWTWRGRALKLPILADKSVEL